MKKILILQFRTDQSLEHERELFSKNFKNLEITFFNVFSDKKVDFKFEDFDGLVVSGSGQFNITDLPTEKQEKIDQIAYIIKDFVKSDKQTLGICFGHQLIAELMGGKVERDESQSEAGTVKISLNLDGVNSKIFNNFPDKFWAAEGHKESVTKLPTGAISLASSDRTNCQSYKIGKNVFTVQFHPEFKLEDLLYRLSLYPEYMKDKTLEDIKREHHDIPHAYRILTNFQKIV